jgi:hypothetical protein
VRILDNPNDYEFMQIVLRLKPKKMKVKDENWHLWFAWFPVIISKFGLSDSYPNNNGIRIFVWLDFVQRKLAYKINSVKRYEYILPQISH